MNRRKKLLWLGLLIVPLLAFVSCIGCGNDSANSPYHMNDKDIDQIERAAILRGKSEEAVKQTQAR